LFGQDPGLLILHITEPLEGELDFSFLGPNRQLNELQLSEHGHVTHLHGLPMTLQKLTCIHNELKELRGLPPSLVELNVSHNHLSTMDFIQTPHLRVFHGSNNRLYSVQHLPATLEEMYVSHNQLSEIDLLGLNRLRILHCLHNPHPLILIHVPSQTIDLKMDDGPLNQIQLYDGGGGGGEGRSSSSSNKQEKPSISYQDALNTYMGFKSQYETNAKNEREKEKESKKKKGTKRSKTTLAQQEEKKQQPTHKHPKCIHCSKNVGMTFVKRKLKKNKKDDDDDDNDDDKEYSYYASCGLHPGLKQCQFEIQLNAGVYETLRSLLDKHTEHLHQETQKFMQQKMDTLFGYITKETSANMTKEQIESFMNIVTTYTDSIDQYRNIYDNKNKQELIERQWQQITEITGDVRSMMEEFRSEPLNNELLENTMKNHIHELIPAIRKLRYLKYPVMEMNRTIYVDIKEVKEGRASSTKKKEKKDGSSASTKNQTMNLFQSSYDLDKMQVEQIPPKVVIYRVD
jgi:hypothetical protein